jgi:hypothetical protein
MRNDNDALAAADLPDAMHQWDDDDEHLIEDDHAHVRVPARRTASQEAAKPRRQRKPKASRVDEIYVPKKILALRPDIAAMLQQSRILNGKIAAAIKESSVEREDGVDRLDLGAAAKLDRIEALLEQRMQPKFIQLRVAMALCAVAFIFGTVFGSMGS